VQNRLLHFAAEKRELFVYFGKNLTFSPKLTFFLAQKLAFFKKKRGFFSVRMLCKTHNQNFAPLFEACTNLEMSSSCIAALRKSFGLSAPQLYR
jgi:hypothetical protein